jgi:cobalamin biosynthesis protein CbiG
MSRVFAGVGCQIGASADDILAVVQRAAAQSGRSASALAAPAFKAGEPGVREAAVRLGVPLLLVSSDALAAAQGRCVTFSERVERATGVASVAEGCALAAAGANGRLVLNRIAWGPATCAMAEAEA